MDYTNATNAILINGNNAFADCETGTQGTFINADYLNGIMFELMKLLEEANITPIGFDPTNPDSFCQVHEAINRFIDLNSLYFDDLGNLFNAGADITTSLGTNIGVTDAPNLVNHIAKVDGALYTIHLLADYRAEIGDAAFIPNDDTSSYFVTTDYVAVLVQGTNESIASNMARPTTQKAVDRAEITGIISTLMASTNRRAPRVSPIINEKMQRIMGTEYADYVTHESQGATNGGIVFGTYDDATGSALTPVFVFAAPISDPVGSVTLDINIESIDGSDLDDITVEWSEWNNYENGMAQLSPRPNLTRTGSNWTITENLTGAGTVQDLFGLHVSAAPNSGNFEIVDITLTDSNGTVYTLTRRMKRNVTVNLIGSAQQSSVVTQEFANGVEIRNHGLKSGCVPSKFIATPEATRTSGDTNANVGSTESAGSDFHVGTTILQAFFRSEVYFVNGYTPPAVILTPGTYVSHFTVGHLRTINSDIFDRPSEFFIGCPNGQAILSAGTTSSVGMVFGAVDGSVFPKFYLANIHCDATITRPFAAARVHIDALDVTGVNSDTEGFETDYGDLTLERGDFSGAANDGVNSHETGHITMIDCNISDNLDDGFSPHDNCTYEVHGGEYRNNGKGNIIPAFGAKGFCIGVQSSGSTGLSTRIANVEGHNDGGFVCLDNNQADSSPTTLFAIECTSDGDNNGFVSAGRGSVFVTFNSEAVNATNYDLLSTNWRSSTNLGDAGIMVTSYSDTTANTILDTDNRIVNLDDELLIRE